MTIPAIVAGHTTKQDASATTSRTITVPTNSDGDEIHLFIVTSSTSANIASSGFTTLPNYGPATLSGGEIWILKKTAASESGSYTITSASTIVSAIAVAITPYGGIHAVGTNATGTSATATAPAVTTVLANTLRISVIATDDSPGVTSVATLSGHTLLDTVTGASKPTVSVQWKNLTGTGSDASQTAALSGSETWTGATFTVYDLAEVATTKAGIYVDILDAQVGTTKAGLYVELIANQVRNTLAGAYVEVLLVLTPPDGDPTGLTATPVSSSQINLSWADNSTNEDGFEIERSPNGSTGWTLIHTTAADVTSYNNTGLTEATTYYYRVRATNSGGYSNYTSTANALTFPAAPSSLVATADGDNEIDLTWADNSAGETGQKVERSANGSSGWTLIYTAAANAVSYSNTGLLPSATWYYRIGAYNASGTSYSSNANATTAAAPQLVKDIAIRVSFDWDRDGTYTDESTYVISAKGNQRVAPPSQSITANQGQVAQCSVILNNSTGRFSSLNSGGALYSHIGEGKAYQVPVDVEIGVLPAGDAMVYTSVFQGYARIPSEATLSPGQAKTITFDCRSKEDILINKKLRTSQATFKAYRDSGVTESEFIDDLVTAAGADLTLVADDGLVMLPWPYLENESVLEEIWRLCAATGGRFYGSPDGTVNYENAAHWLYSPHNASVESYTRGAGFQSLELSWNDTEIAEEASVTWAEKDIAQPDVIYDSDRIVVPAGETVTIYGDFDAPAYEITAIATTAGTNGGVDLSGDITVTPTYYAQSVKLVIAHAGSVQANVRVKVSGKLAQDTDSQTVTNTSGDSFWTDRVGRSRKVTGNRWVQSKGQASMLLDFIRNRQVLPTLMAKMRNCLGDNYRRIGDRVTITDSEVSLSATDFFVTSLGWVYSSKGYFQDIEGARCTDLYPHLGEVPTYFVINQNRLGSADSLRGRVFF